ncbi:hypothetical protein [Patulibacter defluvii]|uniref:hypothetical protein n=1 Tax=Patulibacter defluvii TaxID=3095358 RepID=UPI002A75AD02|nr:hypothetical protein [Patulibacter sp. DM4]
MPARPSSPTDAVRPRLGWVDLDVQAEHPELVLVSVEVACETRRRSPPWVRRRLDELATRIGGAQVLELRRQEIPAAFRVFFRHIGIDPDERRTPIEQAYYERLRRGHFQSNGLPRDALLAALVETGVPLWALDADTIDGPLGIRPTIEGETVGEGVLATRSPAGRLVIADATRPVAELCGDPLPAHAPGRRTRRMLLYALQIAGVSSMHVHEALWTAVELLSGD